MSDSSEEQTSTGPNDFEIYNDFEIDTTDIFRPEFPTGFDRHTSWTSQRSTYELGSMNFNPRTGRIEMEGAAGALGALAMTVGLLAGLSGGSDSSEDRARLEEYKRRASQAKAEKEAALEKLKLEEELRKLGVPPNREVTDEEIHTSRLNVGYVNNMTNIGIVGRQNEGKSTLVNCFRGLAHDATGSAMTGETEVTRNSTPYVDDKHVGVVWHDISGGGTTQTTAWGYYFEQSLFAYDKLVLVHTSTLSEMDVQILQICKHRKQECVVVRTKADDHIRNCKRRCRHATVEAAREDFIRQVREDTVAKNEEAGEVRELCPGYTDYVVSEMGVAQLVKGGAPSDDPFEQVIDEEKLLKRLHLLS